MPSVILVKFDTFSFAHIFLLWSSTSLNFFIVVVGHCSEGLSLQVVHEIRFQEAENNFQEAENTFQVAENTFQVAEYGFINNFLVAEKEEFQR